jgi:ribosomal protein S18 acetylase RimI-like enzyme
MAEWRTREAVTTAGDELLLQEMLVEAIAWRPDTPRPTVEEVLASPHFALYVEGWGRTGDLGVIAEEDGRPLGACWCRLFTDAEHGYGFVEPSVPELSLAVRREARGRGVGTALLGALVDRARACRHHALSLSVEEDNHAVHLYERVGFVRVRRNGNAWTMRLDLLTNSTK